MHKIKAESFTLKDIGEVRKFQELLDKYTDSINGSSLRHVDLVKAHEWCQHRNDGGKVFAALLDVQINFVLLWCDMLKFGKNINIILHKDTPTPKSILEDENVFIEKMDIHRYSSSFVLRYRALWDKVMGLLVLLLVPNDYEKFQKAKSRKKMFRKIALGSGSIPDNYVTSIESAIEDFDRIFRTAEAHGTGSLRKWTLTMEKFTENPQSQLFGYWNLINDTVVVLGGVFKLPVESSHDYYTL